MLLAFSQPVNCIFWPIITLNWLLTASKLHKLRGTCYTAEWPYWSLYCDVIVLAGHRVHGSAHTNVFALENQSERELSIMILAGLQCSKRCQFNNCFVFFCHGEQSNSHETFAKVYTVNIMLFPNRVGKIAITSLPSNKCWIDILCSHFKTMGRPIADK